MGNIRYGLFFILLIQFKCFAVINGINIPDNIFPSVVKITFDSSEGTKICTGVVPSFHEDSSLKIITAAHCLRLMISDQVTINDHAHRILEANVHPYYNKNECKFDVGILHLTINPNTHYPSLTPLTSLSFSDYQESFFIGYGNNYEIGEQSTFYPLQGKGKGKKRLGSNLAFLGNSDTYGEVLITESATISKEHVYDYISGSKISGTIEDSQDDRFDNNNMNLPRNLLKRAFVNLDSALGRGDSGCPLIIKKRDGFKAIGVGCARYGWGSSYFTSYSYPETIEFFKENNIIYY